MDFSSERRFDENRFYEINLTTPTADGQEWGGIEAKELSRRLAEIQVGMIMYQAVAGGMGEDRL